MKRTGIGIVSGLIAGLLLTVSTAQAKNGVYMSRLRMWPAETGSDDAGTKAPKTTKLLYYGGPVIANVKVYAVFWSGQVDASIQKDIGGFYKAIVNSTHMDWASQYNTTNIKAVDGRQGTNQTIGRGTYGGEYVITPANTSKDLQDTDIHAELEAQVAAGKLPTPDANSLYMIYFPPGVNITIEGQTSCSSFCAYHNGFQSAKLGDVFYGVMPDLNSGSCSMGCGFASNTLDSSTIVSSHEFMEAVTDAFPTPGDHPVFPQAWNTTTGEEVGDLCAQTSGKLTTPARTYAIQGEWDNTANKCVTGPFQSN